MDISRFLDLIVRHSSFQVHGTLHVVCGDHFDEDYFNQVNYNWFYPEEYDLVEVRTIFAGKRYIIPS